jgi:hypothetical protein
LVIVEGDAWKRAFIAATIAIGDSLEESLTAMGEDPAGTKPLPNVVVALVNGLRSTSKSTRATALAEPLRDIMLAIDEAALI